MTQHRAIVNPPQPRRVFHIDHEREILWIIPRKVASSSIRKALGIEQMVGPEEALFYNKDEDYSTIMFARHPWDRITAAIMNVLGPFECSFAQRVQEEILSREGPHAVDWHLWPQSYAVEGFEIEKVAPFEHIAYEWLILQGVLGLPDLPHINQRQKHDWRRPNGEEFDWSPLLSWYEADFEFCEEWEKE